MAKREESHEPRRYTDARRQGGSGGGSGGGGSDRSPLHAQVRSQRTSSSPAWEKKVSAEGGPNFAPSTPGRSRLSTGRKPDDPAEKGPQLPKFGQWDTNDPSSADGFTVIFNKARDEKRSGGAVQRPQSPENQLYKNHRSSSNKKWFCCFGSSPAES